MATSASEIKHWPRWITASVVKHYADLPRGDMEFKYMVEHRTDADVQQVSLMEVRMEGPILNNPSKDYWLVGLEVNILVQTLIDTNMYKHMTDVGLVADMFDTCINLYKYGTGADDDDSQFGELSLGRGDAGDQINIRRFGQIDEDVPLVFSTLVGDFQTCFSF